MPIPTTNSSIKLTPEQNAQLDEMKAHVSHLEDETSKARQTTKGAKIESERALKYKEYQEQILATVTAQVEEKKKESTQLDEDLLSKKSELNQLLSKIATESDTHTKTTMGLKDKEDEIASRELDLSNREDSVRMSINNLHERVTEFNTKVAKLKEVISEF